MAFVAHGQHPPSAVAAEYDQSRTSPPVSAAARLVCRRRPYRARVDEWARSAPLGRAKEVP